MTMRCPNPACRRKLFGLRVLHKQAIKGFPMVPVKATCDHCKREIKVWITNQNLKDIHADLKILLKKQQTIHKMLEETAAKLKEKKGFFEVIRRKLFKRDE